MAKFCSNCGTQLEESVKFCMNCGTQTAPAQPAQPAQPVQPEQTIPVPIQPEPPSVQAEQAIPVPVQPEPPQAEPLFQPPQPVQPEQPAAPVQEPQYTPAQPVQPPQPQPQYIQQQPQPQPAQYPQPYPPAQPYQQAAPGQPYAPVTVAKPKKKRLIPLPVKIIGGFVLVFGAIITTIVVIAFSALGNTAKADYYKLGKDQIPSVKLALGEERKVTGFSTSTSGDTTTQEITYQVSGTEQNEEMFEYFTYLHDKNGFLKLTDIDFTGSTGTGVVARNSADDGYEIQLQIKYDTSGYTISILKQKGGVTPIESEPSATSSPDGTSMPTTSGGTSKAPGGDDTGKLTADVFKIIDGGTYHMKIEILTGDATGEVELYVKGSKMATLMEVEGTQVRAVVKDGKSYAIMDEQKLVMVYDADPDDETPGFGETSNLTFVGEGSGEFNGKNYKYDEYKGKNGEKIFYYVDGGTLKGIRTVVDSMTSDTVIIALDKNVPESVFDVPADYTVQDMTE